MRRETKEKLDRLQHDDYRMLRQGVAGVALLTLMFGLYFAFSRVVVSERLLQGEVRWSVWRIDDETGMRHPSIRVLLDSGQLVRTSQLQPDLPNVGARVVVREKTGLAFNRWYVWEGEYAGEKEKTHGDER